MLYKIAHILRDHCGWIWELAEGANSLAFRIRYASGLKRIPHVLEKYNTEELCVRVAEVGDAEALAAFFAQQPEEDFTYFRPHDFDVQTLRKLLGRTSFLMFVVEPLKPSETPETLKPSETHETPLWGYFFLRSFVHGQSYLGKMVDHEHQGRGIGKLMCKAAMDVALCLGVRMFESINRKNMASMRSTGAVLKQVILEELEHGDLLIEDLPLEDPQ